MKRLVFLLLLLGVVFSSRSYALDVQEPMLECDDQQEECELLLDSLEAPVEQPWYKKMAISCGGKITLLVLEWYAACCATYKSCIRSLGVSS